MRKKLCLFVLFLFFMISTAYSADVYTTKRGKFYHHQDCPKIVGKKTATLDERQAEMRGIRPCPICIKGKSKDIPPTPKDS